MGERSSGARHVAVVVGVLGVAAGLAAPFTALPDAGAWLLSGACTLVGAALVGGARLLNSRAARRREPRTVEAIVRLDSDQARRGVTARVPLTARVPCSGCGGRGRRRRGSCWRCLGTGLGAVGRLNREVRIPAGVRHGSTMTVPDGGAPGGREHPDGDLRLSFLVGGPPPPATEPHRPEAKRRPQGPVTVRNRKRDTEFAVHAWGIVVRDEMRGHGGSRWRDRLTLRWEEIADLSFDYGSHDSLVSLWAVRSDGAPRRPVVDARTFTIPQWQELALAAGSLSDGRIRIDLTRLDDPGILRDS